jgi:hypothetical protein
MKNNRGANRTKGAPALPGAGRPKKYATVRIPIDDARAVLVYLNEQHQGMSTEHSAERGLAFLIAGLWGELNAARQEG